MPTHAIGSQLIPLSQIHINPDQPRKIIDPVQFEELKQSIQERGLINPISLRIARSESASQQESEGNKNDSLQTEFINKSTNPDVPNSPLADSLPHYQIIAGERRFRAAQELGWDQIDARIWPENTPDQEVDLMALVENLQRDDLNAIEIAQGYKILEDQGMSQQVIAQQLGISQPVVARYIGLLDQPTEIQEIMSRDIVTETHMRYLSKIDDKSIRIAYTLRAEKEDWSVKDTERQVNKFLKKKPEPKPQPSEVDPLAEVWQKAIVDPTIARPHSWEVYYSKGSWHFRFPNTSIPDLPRHNIGPWFRRMASLFPESAEKQEQQDYEKKIEPFIAHTKEEQAQMEQESKNAKLPKNSVQWKELEALIPQGPLAAYSWIFGATSLTVRNLPGKTWKDIYVVDPKKALHDLVDSLRILRSL